jgi:SAM-dependent methyltransferase
MWAQQERARVFGEVAELYERRRPSYPSELFDRVLSATDTDGSHVLEAGCGTGRATVELARRGAEVLAFEPDPAMAAIARRACQSLRVRIEESRFEEWAGEPGSIDLLASAQAWHWVDGERRDEIARTALRPGGILAVWFNQVGDWQGRLRDAIDATYATCAPELIEHSVVSQPAPPEMQDALAKLKGFAPVDEHRYRWSLTYDATAWGELIQTHSDHRMLAPEQLAKLVEAVRATIAAHGGELVYPYETVLLTARRS